MLFFSQHEQNEQKDDMMNVSIVNIMKGEVI